MARANILAAGRGRSILQGHPARADGVSVLRHPAIMSVSIRHGEEEADSYPI